MGRNSSETIVQLDLQEINEMAERADRQAATEVVKTSGRSSKCPTPRMEQNRKPFFAGAKSAKVNLQPWPSATNLSRLATNQHQQQGSEVATSFVKNGRDGGDTASVRRIRSMTHAQRPPCISVTRHNPSQDSEDENEDDKRRDEASDNGGFVNSAFSQEYLAQPDVSESSSCHCDDPASRDPDQHSDVCQFQCLHEAICQHPEHRSRTRPQVAKRPRRRFNSCPKFFVPRQSPTGYRKKGVHWRRNRDGKESSVRRKTVDCVHSVKKLTPQTSSSPNLKTWSAPSTVSDKDRVQDESRATRDDKDDNSRSPDKRADDQ